jgi:WD40 repeat protein
MITSDNASEVEILRTFQIPDFRNSSVSQCSLSFSSDGNLLAGVCEYSTAPVWDMQSGLLRYTLLEKASHEVAVAFRPNGDELVIGGFTGEIRLFDPTTGEAKGVISTLPSQVWDLAFNPTGDQLAAATFRSGMYLANYPGWEMLWSLGERERLGVLSVDYALDRSEIAFGKISSGVTVVEAKTGATLANLHLPVPVGDVAYSPDGRWLATASDDNKIRLWNTSDYSLALSLVGHTNYVNGVAFSPDSRLLVSGSHDHKVGLWDVETGGLLKTLEGHENVVLRVAVNPEGSMIASISWDGSVRIWGVVER